MTSSTVNTQPQIAVNEFNSVLVSVPFEDINGVPFIPIAVLWRLWDDTNKEIVQDFVSIDDLAENITFEITGNLVEINNPTNLTETRMVLLQTTVPGGEIRYDVAYFNVLAIPSIPS
jgi:hypothetical protein